ncbi:hypothetical protein ACUL41_15280 [Virgibacillus natechei]|uniref:hypothetical protein n=1 Tax=Virgibacillus sp. CBA3643 TaxID=2942278 RepID=UPI0035A39EA6
MKQKLIPIHREVDKNNIEFTFFIDNQYHRIYKTVKENGNGYKFWIAWALVLAAIRGIQSLHLPMGNPINILIVVFLFIISGALGVYKYKETHKNEREIYNTQNMVEEYIEKGKSTLKGDIITSGVLFLVFIVFMVLFLIYQWLTWLFFALFIFFLFIVLVCYLPPERFKIYKRRN